MVGSVSIPLTFNGFAKPVLRHRIATNFQARAEGLETDDIIDRLLHDIKPPEPEKMARK